MLRKLLNLLFGQMTIVILLMLVQVGLIVSVVYYLVDYFVYLYALMVILSAVVVFHIVNKPGNPTYKLSWVIAILSVPLFGGLFYLFVYGQTATRRFFDRLQEMDQAAKRLNLQSESAMNALRESAPMRVPTVRYVNRVSGCGVYQNTKTTYLPLGEDQWSAMLEDLKKAERYIFLEYFIIKEGEMWDSLLAVLEERAAAGVEVRLLYDGIGCLPTLPRKYPRKIRRKGIQCHVFNPFTPFLSAIQNNRDHRKICVIDGRIAYNGGINLADEYVNIEKPYGHWKDTAVRLEGDAAYSFTVMFLQMWSLASGVTLTEDACAAYRPTETTPVEAQGFVMPYGDTPSNHDQTAEFVYMDLIAKARDYVYITTPYLILDNEMVTALGNAAKSGVDVKIICPSVPDHWYAYEVARSYYKELVALGVKIYEYLPGFIHAKSFVVDGELAVVGSINLDFRSLYLHFECATWMYQTEAVDQLYQDFLNTLAKCRRVQEDEYEKLPLRRKMLIAFLRVFAPLM